MKKINNDEKFKIYKTRKLLRISIIIFTLLTVVFSLLTLIVKLNPIPAVICFIIEVIMTKYRDRIDYKK